MWAKGVFLLGLIVCWTALCNGEDRSKNDIEITDKLVKELAKEYLFFSDNEVTEKKCTEDFCKNGGSCVEDEEGGEPSCDCTDEFKGKTCELTKDCTPETCQNSGTCEEVANTKGYKCKCTGEFKGINCELPKDCTPEICQNSGTCEEVANTKGYTCKCLEEYKGKNCSLKKDCITDLCKNGGICEEIADVKGYTCKCPAEYKGKNCDFKKDCNPDVCKNSGTCEEIAEAKGYTCKCTGEFKGINCELPKDCAPETCQNSGTCEEVANTKGYTCKCTGEFKGKNCELHKDCNTELCKNGGTCNEITNAKGFTCSCIGNWKGKTCEENACDPNPCQNQGVCLKDGEGFKCNCTGYWKGKTCEQNPCTSNPCKNGGTCNLVEEGQGFTCSCTEKWRGATCQTECDCGDHGQCSLDDTGNKQCECDSGYLVKTVKGKSICVATCVDATECNGGQCLGETGKKFCQCPSEKVGDKCEDLKECVTGGLYSKCKDSDGNCFWNVTKVACACPDYKKLDPALRFCRTKCSAEEPCKHEADCRNELCQCKSGTEGDNCGEITGCKTLECDKKSATCTFDSKQNPHTFCVCNDPNYKFVNGRCAEKCNDAKDCQNGGTCEANNLCKCITGTSGDKCENIAGCEALKCQEKDAKCIFVVQTGRPTCKCNDDSFYYDNGQCKPEWCRTGCNSQSECQYNNGVGVCKCKAEGTYYDYAAGTCRPIDKCFNKTCGENEVCKNGVCVCDDNYQKKDDKCQPKQLCDNKNSICFKDAFCEPSSSIGYVSCTCNDTLFYNPNGKKCDDGTCLLPEHKKNCKKSCPSGMERKDGVCKHKAETTACDKDCGTLGWCFKVSATSQKCVCEPGIAEIGKNGTCVLKASAVCPTSEKDGDDKCKCKGQYKDAKNGITCDLKSCSDEDVQNICKNKRAEKCVDNWKGNGYKCMCPYGYTDDPEKGCIDPCSVGKMKDTCLSQGKVCYIGSKMAQGDCRCLPTFTENPTTKTCELSGKNTYVIQNLPVISKKYENAEKSINKVLLNIDVSASMKQAFKKLDFAYVLNFKSQEGVLLCDIWLQFELKGLPDKFDAFKEVQRWKSHAVDASDKQLLPPALYLSSDLKEATEQELTLCTPSVRLSVCGRGSDCVNSTNTCSCMDGFREIDSTIQTYGDKGRIVRCEDIDECKEGTHGCPANSQCVNTEGDYFCRCNPGHRKKEGAADELDKKECIGLCEVNPCGKGKCEVTKQNTVDCTCPAGYRGSFCNKKDENLAKASQATKVVGAVLGTLLAIVIILIIVYIVRQRKNSYSEDFTPAPRNDNAEMIERRPMRGVTNRAYQ